MVAADCFSGVSVPGHVRCARTCGRAGGVRQNARMNARRLSDEQQRWIVQQAMTGQDPETVLRPLLEDGWAEQDAIDAVQAAVSGQLEEGARRRGLPLPCRVPAPIGLNGPAVLDAGDRQVQLLASLMLPRVVVLGGRISDEECDALVELSRPRLRRATPVDAQTGGSQVHADRTSRGTFFERGAHPVRATIEEIGRAA